MGASKDLRSIRRGANKPMAAIMCQIISGGHRYRLTKSGAMIYGTGGAVAVHFTTSDHRAPANLRADLRRIGITIDRSR